MKKIAMACMFLGVFGCKSYEAGSFRTGNINYESLKENEPLKEMRIYQHKTFMENNCAFETGEQSPGAALAISALGYVGKEIIAYGKSELEKRAAYLESDVVINAKALHSSKWPDESVENENSLCILIVAGEFSDKGDKEVSRRFRESQLSSLNEQGFSNKMADYKFEAPGSSFELSNPFNNLAVDPSFIFEAKVISAKDPVSNKWQFYVIPTYLFYPEPLHMMSKTGLSRKLSVELNIGDAKAAINLDGVKSGVTYSSALLKPRFAVTDAKGADASTLLTAKVIEGPDKMPTAKLMRDLAAKDKDLLAWLDARLKELEEKAND